MGIVMLVRLLGQETTVLNSWGESTTFTDVPNWGRRYTEFAEQQGLSKGIRNGKFGANNIMSAMDYTTFLLRSLGYDDSKGDFSYFDSLDFFMEIGAISQEDMNYLSTTEFKRSEMALMSYRALSTNPKGETVPLVEKLGKGWVVRADYTGTRDGSKVGYHIHFTDFGSLKGVVKTYDGWQPYGYPLESCFLYRCVSREYTNSNYFTLKELEHRNFSTNLDDSTVGRGVHGIALCDSSGKELAYMRLFASMDNLEKQTGNL